MATEIKMPQLGETVVEGTITKWLKKEGDEVAADELLVEISTDKVDSEVPSSESGTIEKILVQEGETVKVGTPLVLIGDGSGAGSGNGQSGGEQQTEETPAEQGEDEKATPETDQPKVEATETAAQGGTEPEAAQAPPPEEAPPPAPPDEDKRDEKEAQDEDQEKLPPQEPGARGQTGRPGDISKRGIISPLVRRLADEHGVDLGEIEGTGTGGRIRKQDVLRFVEERKARPAARPAASAEPAPERAPEKKPEPAPAEEAVAAGAREELVPWTNIRRRTAEHMVAAHLETARAWNAVEADWTNVVDVRARVKDKFKEQEGFSLTFMPFLAKVICESLLEMPEVNSAFDEANQANRVKRYVNLGIAVALEGGGLIVPVVKGADEKNLVGLARAISDVATRARSKKLVPDDLAGGTFTITNPGPFGSIISVPIIPRGQTAILGFEAIQKRVVVTKDDAIAIRSMGFLSMSWDHRTIDGAEAARFLARLRERIETTDFSSELSPYA
ncbi:MAG: 2-oxo acid dehydrogenase subunit E2 [Actinomycetota bacterium]|nr:2-oxo acid dehydrogenase subunit E2 [Actinomycetota bacterium]